MSAFNTPKPQMDNDDSREKATEYVRLALPLMNQHKVPPNPINFTTWYEHVTGSNAQLSQEIESIISKGTGGFTPEVNAGLYKRFVVGPDGESLEQIQKQLQQIMADAMGNISSATEEAHRCETQFNEHSRELADKAGSEEIQKILRDVISETRQLATTGTMLREQLQSTTDEVTQLRTELKKVKHAASTDSLTGLLNRGAFDNTLAECINDANVNGTDLCLLMVDIDFFKKVNDTYGHLLGDKVLRFVGGQLKQQVGDKGSASRYGGEEFSLILPGSTLADALALGEQIRVAIAASRLKRKGSDEPLGQITVSVGGSLYRKGEPVEDFMQRADACLYHAKETGRDRVIGEEDTTPKAAEG